MKLSEVEQALKDVEELLRDDSALSSVAEEAIRKLFNLVEALCGDVQNLNGEVDSAFRCDPISKSIDRRARYYYQTPQY
jgi:hypothetical protein